MGARKKKSGRSRVGKWIRRLLALAVVAAVAAVGYQTIYPMAAGAEKTHYAAYTAETGDIVTTMSFSATISVGESETLTNDESATVSKIFVTEDQEVSEGDKIVELSNGEILKAGMDGTVNEISVSEGDWLWRSRSLVQIANFNHLSVSLSVDEYDVQKVQAGQTCTVRIISLGLDLETEISHVNLVSVATGNVARYTATAELEVPDGVLPGMAATVSIPSQESLGVTTLEVAALSFREDGTPFVLLQQSDGSYAEQTVETGLSDGMRVEIVSGISPGDTVWVADGTEEAETFSLAKLYASIKGETVVIQEGERSGGRGSIGGGNASGDTEMPENTEGFSGDLATDTDLSSFTPPSGDGTDFGDSSGEAGEIPAMPEGMESLPGGLATDTDFSSFTPPSGDGAGFGDSSGGPSGAPEMPGGGGTDSRGTQSETGGTGE